METGGIRIWAKYRDILVLLLALILALLCIGLDSRPVMGFLKGTAGAVFRVSEKWLGWIPDLLDLREKNRELQEKYGGLALMQDRYEEALLENTRLRRLLKFRDRKEYRVIPAEIIGRGSAGLPGTIHLDAGYDQGCRKDMVLMTDRGVVGKIVMVESSTSVGQLLTDPNFRISAKVARNGVQGILQWELGNVCQLKVNRRSDVHAGDEVVTSGYSQIYPEGLAIGRIFAVNDSNDLFMRASVLTEVDFESLEEVLIVTSFDSGNAQTGEGK